MLLINARAKCDGARMEPCADNAICDVVVAKSSRDIPTEYDDEGMGRNSIDVMDLEIIEKPDGWEVVGYHKMMRCPACVKKVAEETERLRRERAERAKPKK